MILQHQKQPFLLEFEIKGLPKLTNQINRVKWQARYAYSVKWKGWVKAVSAQFQPAIPLKTAKLTLTRYSSRSPDFDGLVSSFKHVIDALVEVRILENDTFENIGQPNYRWEFAAQRHGKIRVKVEGLSNGNL